MKTTAAELLLLERSPLFTDVPRELRLETPALAQVWNLAGGARLPSNTDNPSAYLVMSNRLGLFADANTHLPLAMIGPSDCVGEQVILGEHSDTMRVVTTGPTRLAVFTVEALWQTMHDNPRIALNLLRILSERVRVDYERHAP